MKDPSMLNENNSRKNTNVTTQDNNILKENPYDIETLIETIDMAADFGLEFSVLDDIITHLRKNPSANISEICFKTLQDLNLMKMKG